MALSQSAPEQLSSPVGPSRCQAAGGELCAVTQPLTFQPAASPADAAPDLHLTEGSRLPEEVFSAQVPHCPGMGLGLGLCRAGFGSCVAPVALHCCVFDSSLKNLAPEHHGASGGAQLLCEHIV